MDYGSWTRENLRPPYYQPSSSSAAENLRAPYYQPSSSSAAATPNGYFTDQAMRAGLFDPPRDLQNERIRVEIRSRESTQSRILEENIRRELELDRVMAARRHEAERFYLPHSQPQPHPQPQHQHQPQPHYEPRLGERIWPAPLPRYPEVTVMYDRFPPPREARVVERYELERVPRYPQAGAFDRFQPPAHDPRPVFRKKQPLARPLEMRASGSKLSGTKRKAVATAGVSEYSRPEKWCCKACKVEVSSEKGLKEHYQGKKHKAALEESRGGDQELTGKKTLGDKEVTDKKILGEKELTGKKPLASSKPAQRKVEPVNETKKSTTQQKQSVDTSEGKLLFWCETCKLKCTSQTMLESHLNGKRHKAALDELAGGGIGSAKTAKTPTKPDSEKMELLLELESLKDEMNEIPPKLDPQKNEKTEEDEKMEVSAELEAEKTKEPSEMEAENIEALSEMEVEKDENADKKTLGDKELTSEKPLASSKPVQRKVLPVNEIKKSTTQQKQSFDTSEGKPLFWCETCKLKCTSQIMLESHLNGKRHKAVLDELAGGGIGSAKTADTPTKPDSKKMEVPLELESIKDKKTDVPPKLNPQKDEKTEEDKKMEVPAELEAEKTKAPSEMEAEMAEIIKAPSDMEAEKADKKTLGNKELTGKKPLASSKPVQRKVEPVNETEKSTTQQKQKQKQSVDTSEGEPLFWCETCKLKCNSQTMLESHLNGKRHKAALNELAGGGIGSAKTAETPTKPESEKMEVPLELESVKDEKTDVPPKLYPQKDEKTEEDEKMEAPAELEAEKTEAPAEMEAEMAENIEAPFEMEVEKAENIEAPSEMVAEKAEKTDAPSEIEAEGNGKPAAAVETEVPAKLEPEKNVKPTARKANIRPTRKRAKRTAVGAASVKKSTAAEEA